MSVLRRKLARDLVAQRGPALAVALVMTLGVALFVASAGAYRDLRDSYAHARARLALAALHVDLATPATDDAVARASALPAVALAEGRVVAELPVSPAGRAAALRVLSLPDEGAPRLDRVRVIEGSLPRGPGEVLLERHFAERHRLHAGSTLARPAGAAALRVSGVGLSAEHLWVARDANDFLPSPDAFGVGWMRRGALVALAGDALRGQLLVDLRPGAARAEAAAAVVAALGDAAVRVTPADALVGVKLLQLDLDGYKGMAAFFPVFFLGVGAAIMASVLARLVDAQRALIGTFLALGVSRRAVLGHYLAFALALGGGGALVGALLGALAAAPLTRAYATELNIPFVVTSAHLDLAAAGLALGSLAALVAGALPALRAMRLRPAEAMRPPAPSVSRLARAARHVAAPLPLRLALRGALDRPLRSLGTALGVAAAVVLVLSTGALMDSMGQTFRSLFFVARPYALRVELAAPAPRAEALARARAATGVRAVEGLLALPGRLRRGGVTVDALVQARDEGDVLTRAADADGAIVAVPPGALVLTRAAARSLHAGVGDAVEVSAPPGAATITLRLAGYADAAMGPTATVRRADVAGAWGLTDATTAVLATVDPGSRARARDALAAAFPSALAVEDAAATRAQFDQLMGLGWLMLGVMLAFGGVLSGAIVFNTATLMVLERRRELATLRALGMRPREVTTLVMAQGALLAGAGLALGVPLALLAARAMLAAFASELFALPFVLRPATVAASLGGVFVVALLAQRPALSRVARTSLAEAVRTFG